MTTPNYIHKIMLMFFTLVRLCILSNITFLTSCHELKCGSVSQVMVTLKYVEFMFMNQMKNQCGEVTGHKL